MSNYYDLVLAKHESNGKSFLFKAPAGTYLKEDDLIIVETCKGEAAARVMMAESYISEENSKFDMIVAAAGATRPLKRVIGRFRAVEWPEDKAEETDKEEVTDGE